LIRTEIAALCLLIAMGFATPLPAQMTDQQIRDMAAKYPPLAKPSNLQVLPKDITIWDLQVTMTRISEGLGVQCTFCHAFTPDHKGLDFKSDANPMKAKARIMLRMTTDINGKYLTELGTARVAGPVTCGNCHMGKEIPPAYKPPAGYVLE
jgi:hypothetical protein